MGARQGLLVIVAIITSLYGCSRQEKIKLPPGWVRVERSDLGFELGLPKKPKEDQMNLRGLTATALTCEEDGVSFIVFYMKSPKPLDTLSKKKDALAGFTDSIIKGGHKVLNEREISRDNVVGREFLISTQSPQVMKIMVFANDKGMFTLTTVCAREKIASPDIEMFFDSLRLK